MDGCFGSVDGDGVDEFGEKLLRHRRDASGGVGEGISGLLFELSGVQFLWAVTGLCQMEP